jgi:hypothetical protein
VLLLGFGLLGLLVDLAARQAHFLQEQGHLGAGELLGLRPEEAAVEQADVLILELDDALEPEILGPELGENLGGVGLL